MGKVRALFKPHNMTEGNIRHELVRFSVPLLIGNLAQQLYQTIDAIIVSRAVPNGLGAIGTTIPIMNFFILLFMAIATGAGIMVAQYFGARKEELLLHTIGNTILLIVIASVIIIGTALPLSVPILELLDTPPEIFEMSADYLRILFIGVSGVALYNIISGILRALGDSFSPLLYLIIASVINIILDLYFVKSLGWGVAGAGWATVISQAISGILCLLRLWSLQDLPKPEAKHFRPDWTILREILRLGLPAGLTQGVFSLAMIMVQRLTNSMGTFVINANTAVMRIDGFAMMPNFTFGMAISTFIGQNLGAGRMDRVQEGVKVGRRLALGVSTALTILLLLFSRQALMLFTDDPLVIDIGYVMIQQLAVGYIAFSQLQIYGGILRGAGDTMPSLYITLFTTVVFRVPLAYLLAHLTTSPEWPNGSPYYLNVSLVISWCLGALLNFLWYRHGSWRDKKLVGLGETPSDLALEEALEEIEEF